MCHRIEPLRLSDLYEALKALRTSGRARVPRQDPGEVVPDAYPGKKIALFVPTPQGSLEPTELTWGFDGSTNASSKLVFNTRIDTALSQARWGRGLWAEPIQSGRCLIPVRSFYESWTRMPPQRGAQVRFSYPGHQVFLLAGVWQNDRCSIVTTEPNASVAPMHSRMPLVLAPGESSIWLGPEFASLADRSRIVLDATQDA
ncbi:MAG: SOS response-associated peptidase family protein [Atopobiaceae bacterium]|nr:SOS response-associated peptidase family protein [Atopobiaceae bacterium]MBR1829384.1 SOS response-associated peptidase family protein [Atopobiaceae bacterium]